MPIHSTFSDEEGQTFRVVKGWWLKALTITASLCLFLNVITFAVLLDTIRSVEDSDKLDEKLVQRARASGEVAISRYKTALWMYNQLCDEQKRANKPCPNVTWWADPDKYPLITNDPIAAGLFEPKK